MCNGSAALVQAMPTTLPVINTGDRRAGGRRHAGGMAEACSVKTKASCERVFCCEQTLSLSSARRLEPEVRARLGDGLRPERFPRVRRPDLRRAKQQHQILTALHPVHTAVHNRTQPIALHSVYTISSVDGAAARCQNVSESNLTCIRVKQKIVC